MHSTHANALPTIDDFTASLKAARAVLADLGVSLSVDGVRNTLRTALLERREAYFAAAADHADLERRQRVWEREQFSSLFNR